MYVRLVTTGHDKKVFGPITSAQKFVLMRNFNFFLFVAKQQNSIFSAVRTLIGGNCFRRFVSYRYKWAISPFFKKI